MFRKPKRKAGSNNNKKASLRRKDDDDDERETGNVGGGDGDSGDEQGGGDDVTSQLLAEVRKRAKPTTSTGTTGDGIVISKGGTKGNGDGGVMHTYKASAKSTASEAELATSINEMHGGNHEAYDSTKYGGGDKKKGAQGRAPDGGEGTTGFGADGIFRDKTRNKFLAGPIRASSNVRVTARFDYQPDICKDYKDTGFCGFGDTCIYLHDRGDTLSGWQLEQQWEQQQKAKKDLQEQQMDEFMKQHGGSKSGMNLTSGGGGAGSANSAMTQVPDDGIPFACLICREPFNNPVVTRCQHYFCETCIMDYVRQNDGACPVCQKDTGSVFNQPTKLLAKKRQLVGSRNATWEQYYEVHNNSANTNKE